jgi:hypothetical protein
VNDITLDLTLVERTRWSFRAGHFYGGPVDQSSQSQPQLPATRDRAHKCSQVTSESYFSLRSNRLRQVTPVTAKIYSRSMSSLRCAPLIRGSSKMQRPEFVLVEGSMKYTSLLFMLTLLGCSAAPTVKSWLDPVSSATITAQSAPLIVARDRGTRSINERDFAQLTAVEVNRMGERRLYLVVVLWSSEHHTRTVQENFEKSFARVELRMADRSTTLTRHLGDIAELGIGQSPLPLSVPGSRQLFFPIERADLNALADSNRVQLVAIGQADAPLLYEEWQDGRRSLNEFLGQLPNSSNRPGN